METLKKAMAENVESLDPKDLAILAETIIDAAIGGDFLALKFLLEAGLCDSE